MDLRGDPARRQRAVKPGEALLQQVVQADPFHVQRIRRGCDAGILEQLFRQRSHGFRPFADDGKMPPGFFRQRLLLQQIEIPTDRRQRCAQIVGYVRDGRRQFVVPGLQPQALLSKRLKLPVDPAGQCLNGSVPGRNGDQRIRVRPQFFIQFLRHFANGMAQRQQIEQQEKNTERKRAGQKNPPKLHRKPLTSNLCAGRMPCPPQSTAAQCPRTPPWTAPGASAHGSPAG